MIDASKKPREFYVWKDIAKEIYNERSLMEDVLGGKEKYECRVIEKTAYQSLKEQADKLEKALENTLAFHEEGCRFDHNGNCQNHGSFGYDNGCDIADAFEAVASYKKFKGEL